MRTRPLIPVSMFAGWTLFVWVGRIRNALGDDALSAAEVRNAALFAGVFVVGALAVVVAAVLARGQARTSPALRASVVALAVWTTGVWVVKVIDIAFGGDHPAGFVVVHAVLAAVSIALAVTASRAVRRPGGNVPTDEPPSAPSGGADARHGDDRSGVVATDSL